MRFSRLVDDITNATPQQLPALDEFMKTDEWRRLASGAKATLARLQSGGRADQHVHLEEYMGLFRCGGLDLYPRFAAHPNA